MSGDRARIARSAVWVVALVWVAVIWVRLAINPSSDLLNHREFGRRLIAGEFLYSGGLDYPYLPTWALAHAPLAGVPARAASALVFPIGLAALATLLWIVNRLSRRELPVQPRHAFWVTAAAVFLTSRFLIRDLLDGGENLILTAFVWGALYCWHRARNWSGSVLLGAAIALKLTAGIFLLVLVIWRRWTLLAQAIACAVFFVLLPAAAMGPGSYSGHVASWVAGVRAGIGSADPSVGVLGSEPLRNLALRPAVGRLLITDHATPAWRSASAWVATAAMLAVTALVVQSLVRRRRSADTAWPVAWATAGVLGLLLSPITWRAHVVAILPACYLLIRRWIGEGRLWFWGWLALIAIAVPGLILARGVLGQSVSDWVDRWSLTTWAFVCLIIGLAAWPVRR